ncbi:MAG: head GIN domain-containing protein [Prevotella sp.]
MKKITFMTMAMASALIAGTSVTLASCSEASNLKTSLKAEFDDNDADDGVIVTQNRKVGNFTAIRIEGSPTVRFVQGDKFEVKVKGKKELVEKIKTEVEGNRLVVSLKSKISFNFFNNKHKKYMPVIYVTSPDLVGVELAGSGDFISDGAIDTDRLDVKLAGSGDVDFNGNVICDDLKVELNGSGDVDIKNVEAITSSLKLVGSGDIDVKQKNVEHTKIQLIGSGDIKVSFDNCRDVESSLAGSGDVTLKGNITGRLDKAKAGSGDYIIELRK